MRAVTIAVRCYTNGSDQAVSAAQVRAVYFPSTANRPHVAYLCPACNDAHRVTVPLDVLDQIRDAGAPTDWPEIPSHLPDEAA